MKEFKNTLIELDAGGDQIARQFLRVMDNEKITERHICAMIRRYSKRLGELKELYDSHLKFCAAERKKNMEK